MTNKNEKLKTKVLLNFKVFEKIKQVSSTKLTNWYKTSVVEKQDKLFHRLIFLGANLKSQKILLSTLRASFPKKNEKLFFWKKLTKSKTPGLNVFKKKRDLIFFQHLVKNKFENWT